VKRKLIKAGFVFAVVTTAGIVMLASAQEQNGPTAPPAAKDALLCEAMEVKTAEQLGVAAVIFHQANKPDGPRLGELLRQNDAASVEFETSDGRSHKATLFRLGTCFGRGLLLFSANTARLTPKDQFWLRVPLGSSR